MNNEGKKLNSETVVGILNWNGEHILNRCVEAARYSIPPETDIWVIDNNSEDNSLKLLQHKYPEVKVLKLDENYGFAGAYNIFFKEVVVPGNYRYLALLNNDILITPGWLEPLIQTIQKYSGTAAVTSLLYAGQTEVLQNCGLTLHTWGACDSRYNGIPEHKVPLKTEPVFGFCGGAALLSTEVIKECGFFDDIYFAYYEDADLSFRFRLGGYQVYFSPDARAWHLHSQSTRDNPQMKLYLLEKNRWLFLFKFFSWRRLLYFMGPGYFTMYLKKRKAPLIMNVKKKDHRSGAVAVLKGYVDALQMLSNVRKKRRELAGYAKINQQVENIFQKFREN